MNTNTNTSKIVKRILVLIILVLLFLNITESQSDTTHIQTDKQEYQPGESVEVRITVPDINDYKLYYDYKGFEQRYMGDYTLFSFIPQGTGTHYLILRDRAHNEVERYSFELIKTEEPPAEEPEEPEVEEPEPVIPAIPAPLPIPETKPGLRAVKEFFK